MLDFGFENAICYSGYREGQSPEKEIYPTREQVREDLRILRERWTFLRLYDCTQHAETVLEVIEEEKLDLRVLLGAHIGAEVNNEGCPWGSSYTPEELAANKRRNEREIQNLITFANRYPESVVALSVGNEATVDWTDHMVPVESVIAYVRTVKAGARQPVTFCENYVPWQEKLAGLAEEVDFISIHTYPVWEYQPIENALDYTKENYFSIAHRYPHKPVVITEAGWATNSNGRGIAPHHVDEVAQEAYHEALVAWSREEDVLTFVFEAFDEDWKGSDDPMEPEKHWGLFTIDRKPKRSMRRFFASLV